MRRIKRQGLSHFAEMQLCRSVDVVQRAGLQTRNLQKNQIKKTAETKEWRFGRPFLGQNAGRNMRDTAPAALSGLSVVGLFPISAASSTGRCNTIQCIDSEMLARGEPSLWLYSVKM